MRLQHSQHPLDWALEKGSECGDIHWFGIMSYRIGLQIRASCLEIGVDIMAHERLLTLYRDR